MHSSALSSGGAHWQHAEACVWDDTDTSLRLPLAPVPFGEYVAGSAEVESCKKLLALALERAGISDVEESPFSEEDRHVHLQLQNGSFGDYGVGALLCPVLCDGRSNVRSIDLRSNVITGTGVNWLRCGLRNSLCRVSSLDLRDNNIGGDGYLALADLLRSSPHLKSVRLSFAPIGGEVAETFFRSANNGSLALLHMEECIQHEDTSVELCALLPGCREIYV